MLIKSKKCEVRVISNPNWRSNGQEQTWYKDGQVHRDHLPAQIEFGYYQYWFQNGKIKRFFEG